MIKVPSLGLDMIVMANSTDTWSPGYTDKILELFVPEFEPLAQDKPYEGPFPTGVFRSPQTGRAIALGRGDTGYYLSGTEIPIVAIDGHFYPFARDDQGVLRPCSETYGQFAVYPIGDFLKPRAVRFVDYGTEYEMIAVPQSANAACAPIGGRYWSVETGTTATIKQGADGNQTVHFTGRFGSTEHGLENLADGVWRTRVRNRWILPRWGLLLFDGTEAFSFSNISNQNVRFVRQ